MNTSKYPLILSVALAGLALLGGCRSHPSGEDSVQPLSKQVAVVASHHAARPPMQAKEAISAVDLAGAFAADPGVAAKHFAHRQLEITGDVRSVDADGPGVPVLTLASGGSATDPRMVLGADAWSGVSMLKAGTAVRVLCSSVTFASGRATAGACTLL